MFCGVGPRLLCESVSASCEVLTCLLICRIFSPPDVNTQELIFDLHLGYLFPNLYQCFRCI